VIPFIIVQIAVGQSWPNGDQNLIGDLDNFFLHMLVFIYGYFFCFNTNFWKTVQKNLWLNVVGGVICFSFGVYIYKTIEEGYLGSHPIAGAGMLALHGIVFWFCLLAILGLGKRFLNFSNRLLKYATEAALPFYILHQTIIIIIGFYVIQFHIGVFSKYFAILLSSFICTLLVYDVVVKRIPVIRFLFGMRPRSRFKIPSQAQSSGFAWLRRDKLR
jgi:surface polysaccharide O-acyltransferase-like enzyme